MSRETVSIVNQRESHISPLNYLKNCAVSAVVQVYGCYGGKLCNWRARDRGCVASEREREDRVVGESHALDGHSEKSSYLIVGESHALDGHSEKVRRGHVKRDVRLRLRAAS